MFSSLWSFLLTLIVGFAIIYFVWVCVLPYFNHSECEACSVPDKPENEEPFVVEKDDSDSESDFSDDDDDDGIAVGGGHDGSWDF